MTKNGQKPANQTIQFLRLIKRTYIPGTLDRVRAIAIIWGGAIGGLFGGVTAAGYNAMTWLTILSACIGTTIGAAIALSIVPDKKKSK